MTSPAPHSKRYGYQGQAGQQEGGGFWDGTERYVVATASGIGDEQILAAEVADQCPFGKSLILARQQAATR